MVDAAGAIYVIGGFQSGTSYPDVWVSTDGGGWAGQRQWDGQGVSLGTQGY